ncbi:MAG: helix-turn-helix domain-containing protein [Alphaproteobacteria bacterium]|nr:helix-turn-helix domain-containing protein [Alphaproteobacteria bacterium]
MKTKKRTYNPRRVRTGLSYTVQDIAEIYEVHKNAVLRWIKNGLPVIDKKKPYLVYGGELAKYLRKKQAG